MRKKREEKRERGKRKREKIKRRTERGKEEVEKVCKNCKGKSLKLSKGLFSFSLL